MAKKLVCLKNFYDSNFKEDGAKEELGTHKEWKEGDEYTGTDDKERLQEEGCIGFEEEDKPAKGKKAPGKKKADKLEEGEAMNTEGEEAGDTAPASGKEPDGEEPAEEPAKPAKKAGKAKGRGKKG